MQADLPTRIKSPTQTSQNSTTYPQVPCPRRARQWPDSVDAFLDGRYTRCEQYVSRLGLSRPRRRAKRRECDPCRCAPRGRPHHSALDERLDDSDVPLLVASLEGAVPVVVRDKHVCSKREQLHHALEVPDVRRRVQGYANQ